MKILIIGAGPAGLSFAARMAETNPKHEIRLIERNTADARPGFGVTLRSDGISQIGRGSMNSFQHLEGRAFSYRGDIVVDHPNPPSAHLVTISRAALVTGLTELCSRSGVRLHFESDAAGLRQSDLDQFDLVVAADGAHSAVRQRYKNAFVPVIELSRNSYRWLGVNKALHKLTIMLNDTHGVLLAWGYKYTESLSTLIVECSQATNRELGLDGMSHQQTAKTIGEFFARDLYGAAVDCGSTGRWVPFPSVSCAHLRHRNIVLIGDAAHTTHFSQGFGTMFAFDDALTLHSSLAATTDIEQALEFYEATQRPKITQFQDLASQSMEWSETLIEAAEHSDEGKVKGLIESRWPKNEVPSCPGVGCPILPTQAPLQSLVSPGSRR
jgi:anthraniloyl-CoA monooxygenase